MKTCPDCSIQVQETFKFCPNCGNNLLASIVCKNCSCSNEPNSKFCQECGQSLSGAKKPPSQKTFTSKPNLVEVPEPSQTGITIEFPFSTAQSFEFAVKKAQKFASFEQFGTDNKAIYRITISESEVANTRNLVEHLKGWRKRVVYVNGEKVQWDTVFFFVWCYEQKLSSYKPEYYCYGYENE